MSVVTGIATAVNPSAGAVMEPNQLLDMAAFKKLEKMPTKIEMIATIARLLNQVRHYHFLVTCWLPATVLAYVHAMQLKIACSRGTLGKTCLLLQNMTGCNVWPDQLCRCQPSLQSASSRSPPSWRMVSRLLLKAMRTKKPSCLTSSPSQQQQQLLNDCPE